MEPSKHERQDLARRVVEQRLERFGGNRKEAYNAAGVNSAVWTKVEKGERIAERSLVRIVRLLWPETGGIWTRLDPPLSSELNIELQILRNALTEDSKRYLLGLIEEARRRGQEPPTQADTA